MAKGKAGSGKKTGKGAKAKAGGGNGKLFYVYFPEEGGLKLYAPKTLDAGARRVGDLALHLIGAKKVHGASTAFIVSSKLKKPPLHLDLDEDSCPQDFERFKLVLHQQKEL